MGKAKNGKDRAPWQYANLHYSMLKSPAWLHLSGEAMKVWFGLRVRFCGNNNGLLTYAVREAAEELHMSRSTVQRALDELQELGFIRCTRQGTFRGRQASQWRLTDCQSWDGKAPTRDWENWKPPNTKKQIMVTQVGPSAGPLVPSR